MDIGIYVINFKFEFIFTDKNCRRLRFLQAWEDGHNPDSNGVIRDWRNEAGLIVLGWRKQRRLHQ